jgi:hypothetical protein
VTSAPTKQFTLYLDESGPFDDKRHQTVSLIGGYYCPQPALDEKAARTLLDEAYQRHHLPKARTYHANKTAQRVSDEVMAALLRDVLRGIWGKATRGHLVVMRNRGRASILDNHLTYLHLAAECVVSVLRALHRRHGSDFALKVLFARRRIYDDAPPQTDSALLKPGSDPAPQLSSTEPQDYVPRILEHLATTAHRLSLPSLLQVLPSVEVAGGLKHPNLMVADHVCYAIRMDAATAADPNLRPELRQSLRQKFRDEIDRHLLDEVVVEDGRTQNLRRSLHEARFADAALEAVSIIIEPQSALPREALEKLREIISRLRRLPSRQLEHEFRRLFDNVDMRTSLQWELTHGHKMLEALEQHLIAPLRDTLRGGEAWIDFRFQQLCFRVANHRGDSAAAKRHLDAATRLAPDVISRWEMVPLWVELKLDEAVFLTDTCAYEQPSSCWTTSRPRSSR